MAQPRSRSRRTQPSAARWVSHALVVGALGVSCNLGLAAALLVKPLSEGLCWRWASRVAQALWSFMQDHLERRLNAAPVFTFSGDVDAMQPDEGALVIANHQGYADYYLVHALASRVPVLNPASPPTAAAAHKSDTPRPTAQSTETSIERTYRPLSPGYGMLGRCRYFAKSSLVWQVPVFGWSFWAIGMILVSREWTRDASLIRRAFARIKKNRFPCWIVSYLEGTRVTPAKVERSRAYAREHGKVEPRHVLLPRTKGFVATVQELRDSHIRYVYDLTLCYGLPHTGAGTSEAPPLDPPDSAVALPDGTTPRRRRNERPALPATADSTESLLASGEEGAADGVRQDKTPRKARAPRRGAPGLSEVLSIGDLAGAGYSFHVHLERHAIADLPVDEDGLKRWVEDAWVRKDAFLERWYSEVEGRA